MDRVGSPIRGDEVWRNYLSALFSDAFADDRPLSAMIGKYVTAADLADIAREHCQGARTPHRHDRSRFRTTGGVEYGYLRHLFQHSYDLASAGNPWHKFLPGEVRVMTSTEDAAPLS
jgi:hypothetical protein